MNPRTLRKNVTALGAVDWDRRLFDSLIPLPDGTSYNAYLVEGSDQVALIDTVNFTKTGVLMCNLANVPRIDYVVSHHAEPDHSGSIPAVLEKYPMAKVICSDKAKPMLMDLYHLDASVFRVVADGEKIALGGKTLRFIYTPWVHWPETMVSYLEEEKILFSCDFFGSHIATSETYALDEGRVHEAAKRYFAEIMMPFRAPITKNLEKLKGLSLELIAPSHGPVYPRPEFIVTAYHDWVLSPPKNLVAIPYVSMHGSTERMVHALAETLIAEGTQVELFNLAVTDIGKLAMTLVDAGGIVIGTPTVLTGPHPQAAYAALIANAVRPKAQFLSVIGSYGWGGKCVESLATLIPNLKVEVLSPVVIKGRPRAEDFAKLAELGRQIAAKHREKGFANSAGLCATA